MSPFALSSSNAGASLWNALMSCSRNSLMFLNKFVLRLYSSFGSETRFPGHGSPTEPLLFESPNWWLSKYMRFTILKMEYYPFNIRFYELKLHILRQPSMSVSPSHHPHVGDRGEIRCRGSNFDMFTSVVPFADWSRPVLPWLPTFFVTRRHQHLLLSPFFYCSMLRLTLTRHPIDGCLSIWSFSS